MGWSVFCDLDHRKEDRGHKRGVGVEVLEGSNCDPALGARIGGLGPEGRNGNFFHHAFCTGTRGGANRRQPRYIGVGGGDTVHRHGSKYIDIRYYLQN